jgi:transcriptional regulator with XRE-family HTH domain
MTSSSDFQNFLDDLSGYYRTRDEAPEQVTVAERLLEIREMEGLTREELSRISGVEEELVAMIEKQEVYPDIGTVIQLSKSLRINTGVLLGEKSGYAYSLTRKDDRKSITRRSSGKKDHPDYHYLSLADGVRDRHMEAFLVTLSGEPSDNRLSRHEGEEFIYVLQGSVEVVLADKRERLETGDSIYYLSTVPHRVSSGEPGKEAVIMAVIYEG